MILRENELKSLMRQVKKGEIDIEQAVDILKNLPFEDLGYAMIDHHRGLRTGQLETVFCAGKTMDQIEGIISSMLKKDVNIMATKASREVYETIRKITDCVEYHEQAHILVVNRKELKKTKSKILVITAGTSDIPVSEEAAVTAEVLGNTTERLYDVGVAGVHRLLSHKKQIDEASVLVIVAGMDGALPSVVAGLTDKPVIAVPTSVGYGASFGGLSALLAMLNSCASGVSVVNIDNGYGAGYCASIINNIADRAIRD